MLAIPGAYLLKLKTARDERVAAERAANPQQVKDIEGIDGHGMFDMDQTPKTGFSGLFERVKKHMIYSLTVDVHEVSCAWSLPQ